MAKYLQMDGVDDYIKTPSITFNEVLLDISVEQTNGKYYLDARSGMAGGFLWRDGNGKDAAGYTFSSNVYVNGVLATKTDMKIPTNQRVSVRLIHGSVGTDDVNVFSTSSNASNLKGNIYSIKFLNNSTIVAHYDMATGTVQDQSGNGNHATLTGGTWLDDGTGGGTPVGTDGATAFDIRQSIYASSLTLADTKQITYADGVFATDLRQLLYADQSQATDTRIAIYQDGATTQDTAQILYEMSSVAFDTLQEIFNDGQVGNTSFDIRVQLYVDNSAHLDTKQAVYDGGLLRYDVAQVIYESNTTVADVKAIIYADSAIKADARQSIYADGTFDADTLQRILAEFSEYSEVVRIVLEITQRRRDPLAITQKHSDTLEIIQRRTIELNL